MNFNLTIKREDFLKTLKHFKKLCKPSYQEEAVLSFDMKKFIIELGGMKVSTEAEGIWEKDVRVSNHFVMGLSRTHPRGDPINVSVEDNHLKIGTTKFKCKIQGSIQERILLPMEPSPGRLLALKYSYNETEIEENGLTEPVNAAEERCKELVEKVCYQLRGFEIPSSELYEFIFEYVGEKFKVR
tara:strand:+ start:343 stop:897 length:555 start_codon:yes stop_codon:yes gene_type:complete